MQDIIEMAMTGDERRLGFSVQTLIYPQGEYELSGLQAAGSSPLERTVALTLDDAARLRRQRHGSGYILERREGEVWRAAGEFASLGEVDAAGLVRRATDLIEDQDRAADSE